MNCKTLLIFCAAMTALGAGDIAGIDYWRTFDSRDVFGSLNGMLSAGMRKDRFNYRMLYVCRAKESFSGQWTPGYLLFDLGETICHIGTTRAKKSFKLDHENRNKVQIFAPPAGCAEWSALPSNGTLPEYYVPGGANRADEVTPVCRVQNENGSVNVGEFQTSTKECLYNFYEEFRETESVEILVLRKYCAEQKNLINKF